MRMDDGRAPSHASLPSRAESLARAVDEWALASLEESVRAVVERTLATVAEELGLEVAYLTEFEGDRQVIRFTSGNAAAFGLEAGVAVQLAGSYCQRVIDGRIAPVVPDTSQDAETSGLPVTAEAGIGAYVGVPVKLSESTLYGTLCAASRTPVPELAERDMRFMTVLARMLADTIQRERSHAARHAHVRRARDATVSFFNNLSHELRSPLNSILGFAQLMEMDDPRPEHAEHLRQIRLAGAHVLELLGESLDLARIEAGKLPVSAEPVAVSAAVREAIGLLAPVAVACGTVIDPVGDGPEIYARADRTRLRQVLLNLLSNGIKYGRGRVHVRCLDDDGQIRISVSDNGPGIAEQRLGLLFAPFERLDADTGDHEGSGLGLALTKELVELMDGSIEVASSEGDGTSFTVVLPSTADREHPARDASAGRFAPEATSRRRFLHIEDDPANQRLVRRALAHHGVVVPAADGTTGIQAASSESYDLILLDLGLDDMSGLEVLSALRAQPGTRDIPVIVVSGAVDPETCEKLDELGAGLITKPWSITDLIAAVERASAPAAGGSSRSGDGHAP